MKPLFLVYTDDPMCSIDCADAVCDVLNSTDLYEAKMIGPHSYPYLEFKADNLYKATCFVVPGGLGDADQFDIRLTKSSKLVNDYVRNGGRYLGICQGSYFAGQHYFKLLKDIDAAQYIKRRGASIKRDGPAVVELFWDGMNSIFPKPMYFHDGAAFVPLSSNAEADVFARYTNGDVAALIQKCDKGKVGVFGPHPEAMKWWFYSQHKLHEYWKNAVQHECMYKFVDKLLK